MAPRIFLQVNTDTCVTGFVGGTAFSKIHEAHPDYDEYTLHVRNEGRAKTVAEKYPNVKFVYGDFENTDNSRLTLIIDTAESADSVPATKAIAKGLTTGHTAENPGYYIHLSGAGILTWYDLKHRRYGEPPLSEQKYSDINDLDRILNLPNGAIHKDADKIVQSIDSDVVRFLIVAPPIIYGRGNGLVNKRSLTLPNLTRATIGSGYTPFIGASKAQWGNVLVKDLADLFNRFVEASQDPHKLDNPEIWDKQAYYFARGGEHQWEDVAIWVAEEAHRQGYLLKPETKSITFEEVIEKWYVAGVSWGVNSKG
ncbi:hypothetical protein FSARC_6549 [Fusarium sarcochroum]|uniref:NAD(P)-binding domain-containing protein n=1 Tax=Fusarium sarcochroum TaxID=1208366 RepID=A0A8H4TWX9_9HYPO|nr:hypothetical protein FSARC_6549 [Fusarium sarcochroum]